MHDHDRGAQRPTDRCIDSDDEQDQEQDKEWFKCGLCGARYRSRRAAMQCCAGCFDDPDPDHDPRSPPVAMTDGGQCAGGVDRDSPIGGDCDKHSCKRAAVGHAGPIKVCHDHREWGLRKHRSYQDDGKSTGTEQNGDSA